MTALQAVAGRPDISRRRSALRLGLSVTLAAAALFAGACSRADEEVPVGGNATVSYAKPRSTGLDTSGTTRPVATGTSVGSGGPSSTVAGGGGQPSSTLAVTSTTRAPTTVTTAKPTTTTAKSTTTR